MRRARRLRPSRSWATQASIATATAAAAAAAAAPGRCRSARLPVVIHPTGCRYAKSGRSSCTECSKTIANKSLRLGVRLVPLLGAATRRLHWRQTGPPITLSDELHMNSL